MDEAEDIEICLAVRAETDSQTKADVSKISEISATGASFRGLDQVYIIPFAQSGTAVQPDSEPLSLPLELPGFQPTGKQYSHLYQMHQAIPKSTAMVLAYGKGLSGTGDNPVKIKQVYGSLVEPSFDGSAATPGDLRFSPEPMYSSTTDRPQEALTIASALTTIVNGSSFTIDAYYLDGVEPKPITVPWGKEMTVIKKEDSNLSDCYQQLTAEGRLLPGSGASVEVMLTTLYKALTLESIDGAQFQLEVDGVLYPAKKRVDNVESDLLYKDIFNGLREVIKGKMIGLTTDENHILDINTTAKTVQFHNTEELDLRNYPENRGLPSGAASVRWTPTGYVVPLQNGLDGIAALSDYCFPPALYYRANTLIQTSNEEVEDATIQQSRNWAGVLAKYYQSGGSVTHLTASMALKDPLNFAVGMLSATIQADKKDLLDRDYNQITLADGVFPLTGIIIGRQYPQKYDFTPAYTSEEDHQYYLYDSEIKGISLSASPSGEFRTLVLQTPPEKSVYICLEFKNKSNTTFYGIDEGRIMPDHHFYLVGLLEVPDPKMKDENGKDLDAVFIQDRVTSVSFTIKSLANAYSTIPDMGIPQLSIGVLAQINWEMATPTEVWLD